MQNGGQAQPGRQSPHHSEDAVGSQPCAHYGFGGLCCLQDPVSKELVVSALAGLFSWWECRPVYQTVVGSIPCQGTYLSFRFNLWLGHICEATNLCFSFTLMFLSLCPSISLPVSLSKINKYMFSGED